MTAIAVTDLPRTWDEPEGVAPRGTLILLTGRGETAATYARFGRRVSADAYKVRIVEVDSGDLDAARAAAEALAADEALPAPKVLVGSDTGATLAALLVGELPVDAAVIAGLALPRTSAEVDGEWEDELEVRSACPTHRGTISADAGFARGALADPPPWDEVELSVPEVSLLVIHGREDRITPVGEALKPWVGAETVEQHVVEGGRHDILNDVTHRSVAATVILFLERLKLGADLPVIVRQVGR